MTSVRVAKTLRVVRSGAGPALLEIDGELFEFATVDGFTVHPQKGHLPSVSLSIVGFRVEVTDDATALPEPVELKVSHA